MDGINEPAESQGYRHCLGPSIACADHCSGR